MSNTVKTRTVSARSLVRTLDGKDYRKPIPVYFFRGRTFYEKDKTGPTS